MIFQNADIIDKEKKDIIYVITPFKKCCISFITGT